MTTTQKAPPVALNPTELINVACPEKPGYLRRVYPLWGNFYRINYYADAQVKLSYFIEVVQNDVVLFT